MSENTKQPQYDVDGYEILTSALMELINQYPALKDGDEIAFSTLSDDGGKAVYPISGAIVETEFTDILGETTQECLYPFVVIYRAADLSESRKKAVKEWLDQLGKWLEKQPVTIDGEIYRIEEYPPLTENRKLLSIARQSPAFLESISDDRIEDWRITISAKYRNNF